MAKITLEWEMLDLPDRSKMYGTAMFRARVPNGWLVLVRDQVKTHVGHSQQSTDYVHINHEEDREYRSSITFVPDWDNNWQ